MGTIQQAPTLSTKVVHGSGQDPIFGGSDGDKDGFRGRRSDVDIRDVLHCPAEENISVISHPILPHEQRTLQCGHRCFLLFLGRFCVHIPCGGDVRMTHDFLNDFQIGFVFAEAGAERMPEMMAAKVGQKNRVTIFCISLGCFFLIIVCTDCMNRAIDHSRQIDLAFPRTEHKSRIAINFIRGESNHLLILIFFQKCVEHIIQHRDDTDACTGFRGVDMIRAGAIFLNAIDQIVIDADRSILEVNVLPPQTQHFPNATASTEHYCKQWIPSAILFAVGDVIGE